MIEAEHPCKHFGKTMVLDDVGFTVGRGELVCLLGANGAGKSTLFDILVTLDDRYTGEVRLMGLEPRGHKSRIRAKTGYVPGKFSLYGDLTTRENLAFFASAYGCPPEGVAALCPELWDSLEPFASLRTMYLSGGMKQKLALCCALIHSPEILFLDEPTTGIDPASRRQVWATLRNLTTRGMTILVSTHYLDEVARADRALFIHRGVVKELHNHAAMDGHEIEELFIEYIQTQEPGR